MKSLDCTEHWAGFALRNRGTTLAHTSFEKAMRELKRIMATPDDTWLAQLVAPTGAGKTHTATVLHGEILDRHANEIAADPTYMPSVYVSMSLLGDKVAHSWSDDYWKILVALGHPNPRSSDLSEARAKLRDALVARRTELLILDEAAHFILGCKPGDVTAIKRRANVVKSLTEDTQTRLLLCATFDLLPMIRADGQLARRNQVVHLRRYRNTKDDRAEFYNILVSLNKTFSDYLSVSLIMLEDELYEGCVGLVGVLRNWLVRASTSAEHAGRRGVSKVDLDATKLSLRDLTPILEEAMNGEEQLGDSEEAKSDFRKLLNEDTQEREIRMRQSGPENTKTGPDDDKPTTPKRRPGRRKPSRPRLGGEEDRSE